MKALNTLVEICRRDHPQAIPIILVKDTKRPMYQFHKDVISDSELWKMWDDQKGEFIKKGYGVGLTLRGNICAIDCDDRESNDWFIKEFPDANYTSCDQGKKGFHYFFSTETTSFTDCNLRPDHNIDIKYRCSTGTGGIICIPPTIPKKWVRDITHLKPLSGKLNDFITNSKSGVGKRLKTIHSKQILSELVSKVPIQEKSYQDWFKLGSTLFQLDESNVDIFLEYSKRSEHWDERGALSQWSKFKKSKKKLDYYRILEGMAGIYRNEPMINVPFIVSLLLKHAEKFDFAVCTAVEPRKEMYYFTGSIWKKDYGMANWRRCIQTFEINTLEQIDSGDINTREYLKGLIKSVKGVNNLIDEYCTQVIDLDFIDKLDSNKNLLGFENLVFDLKLKKFREYRFNDYISLTTKYDIPVTDSFEPISNTEIRKELEEFINKIYPDSGVKDYVLSHFAKALSGEMGDEECFTHSGTGGNGKTRFFELIKEVFGSYFHEMDISFISKDNKTDPNKPNPVWDYMRGKRIFNPTEPEKGTVMNVKILKKLTSQEPTSYRKLYENDMRVFRPQGKLDICCNDKLILDESGDAIERRIVVIPYESKFLSADRFNSELNIPNVHVADLLINSKFKTWKEEFMLILLEIFGKGVWAPKTDKISRMSSEYSRSGNLVHSWALENLEVSSEDGTFLKGKEIWLKFNTDVGRKVLYKDFKEDLMKAYNVTGKTDVVEFFERRKYKGSDLFSVFFGIKMLKELQIAEDVVYV